MILRILLTLLILTYSDANLLDMASECVDIGKEGVECDSLLSYNGTGRVIVVKSCNDLGDFDDTPDFGPWHSVNNVTFECSVSTFPWNFTRIFPNIRYINLPQCNLTSLAWQQVYAETLKVIDLFNCPIECTCQNQWMRADGTFERLKEPMSLRKCMVDCDQGHIRTNESVITGLSGQNVSIRVDIADRFLDKNISRPYFEWAYAKGQHNYQEIIGPNSAELFITNLTREDIGLIGVRCWHCVDYLTAKVELRVKLPIKVEFVEKTRGDTDFFVVQGYPIENLTLAITRLPSNISEVHALDTEHDSVYFSSLLVRPEKRSIFYQRTYRIFTKDAAEGDHLSGDLRFEVCTLSSCDTIEKHVSHLGVMTSSSDDYISFYGNGSGIMFYIVLAAFCLLLVFFLLGLVFRKKMIRFRKRISWSADLQTRRASQETEETLLRLEERSSLYSDYTDQLIPIIQFGAIQFHEKIGSGQFGEVYCATWEKLGERSIAVKTIKNAPQEVEKEANTILGLDHPNIVKCFGLTRLQNNLLIVFEFMKLGDLKHFLEARKPSPGTYLQFPPALKACELRKIIYEIVCGLAYLVERQIVHRDLAARNVLVSGASDLSVHSAEKRPPITIKISDFGMSRQLISFHEYYTMEKGGKLPIRWLPPEAVYEHTFTYMSDVWSLGVVMWECWSYGGMPYGDLTNGEVSSYTVAGMRPKRPPGCPDDMHAMMNRCWQGDPTKRVTAHDLLDDPAFDSVRKEAFQRKANGRPVQEGGVEETSFTAAQGMANLEETKALHEAVFGKDGERKREREFLECIHPPKYDKQRDYVFPFSEPIRNALSSSNSTSDRSTTFPSENLSTFEDDFDTILQFTSLHQNPDC